MQSWCFACGETALECELQRHRAPRRPEPGEKHLFVHPARAASRPLLETLDEPMFDTAELISSYMKNLSARL
jgi:hypothetical protein